MGNAAIIVASICAMAVAVAVRLPAVRGWIQNPLEAMAAIDAATRIASRIGGAFAAVEAAQPLDDRGSPYRPMLDDTPTRDAAEMRSREVRELEALRARRGLT